MTATMKKTFVLLLTLCIVMGIMSGCVIEDPEATWAPVDIDTPIEIGPVPDHDWQEITISVMGAQGVTDNWGSTVVVQAMKEMFGITMNCTPYSEDDWPTKLTLMQAEDDFPDLLLCSGLTVSNASNNGSDGYFYLNFMDYIEYMPNLAKFLNEHRDYRRYVTARDGGIYGLPQYTETDLSASSRNFLRTSWLENLGLEMPDTVDELYEVLKAFKEQDANGNGDPNDEIPMMWANYSRTPEHALLPAFGIIPAGATAKTYYILQTNDEGQVYLADSTDNYRAYLQYMSKLWEEELIYHDSYTIDIKMQRELTKADRVGVFSDSAGWNAKGDGDNSDDYYYRSFQCLTSDYNSTPMVIKTNGVGTKCWFAVSKDTEHPEEICRMIDYFFSDEGAMFGTYGDLESWRTYKAYEVAGLESCMGWFTSEEKPKGYDNWETYRFQVQTINNAFNVRNLKDVTEDIILDMTLEELDVIINGKTPGYAMQGVQLAKRMKETNGVFVTGYPNVMLTEEESREYASLEADIKSYCQTQKAQFLTGELDINDDDEWQNYLNTLDRMGLPRLLEIQQQAYDRLYG